MQVRIRVLSVPDHAPPAVGKDQVPDMTPNGTQIPTLPDTSVPKEPTMSIGTIMLIILILALVGALPTWSHSSNWGYGPSGGLGIVVLILIVLLLMGRI